MKSPRTEGDCARNFRWERSEWPHPKLPRGMGDGPYPDVIWLRIHRVFLGGMMDEVTGWQSTNPNGASEKKK